jgi:endonuclease/exonuclease/phosphatase family metal-dependent hydrolase
LRVVTFNIKHGLVTGSWWRVDLGRLGRTCAGFDADVLALQEVDRRSLRTCFADEVAVVARATGLTATFGETRRGLLRGHYGNALFTRGPASDVEVLRLPGRRLGEPRGAILATAAVGGSLLSVAATHLSTRRSEARVQLATLLESLEHRPLPRLLLGDLNLGLEVVEPAMTAAGYLLASTGATFPAERPERRIDYIAVAGLVVVEAHVPEVGLSDHRPVVAVVRAPATVGEDAA